MPAGRWKLGFVAAAATCAALASLPGAARPALTTFDSTRTIQVDGRPTFPIVLSPGPPLGSTTPWGTNGLAETVGGRREHVPHRAGRDLVGGRPQDRARVGSRGRRPARLHLAEPRRLLAGAAGLDRGRGAGERRQHADERPERKRDRDVEGPRRAVVERHRSVRAPVRVLPRHLTRRPQLV